MTTTAQIDVLLPFLDKFTVDGFQAGTWQSPPGQLPWLDYQDSVIKFQKLLYEHGWIDPFDWVAWRTTAQEYILQPNKLASADLDVLRKLLTTHVRQDRFCEGHLASMFQNGHIVAILQRLKGIRQELTEDGNLDD
ncbi:MAG: DUF6508 domain-containing protein [Pirellulales bacterium]